MSALAFDTHTFVKDLTQAGMPEPQAEVLANQQQQLLTEQLASKLDIQALQRDIKASKAELTRDIKALDIKIEASKAELKRDIKELESKLTRDIKASKAELTRDIKELESRLTIKLGGMLVVGISVIAVLMKLL